MRRLALMALLPLTISAAAAQAQQQQRFGPADGADLAAVDLERIRVGQAAPDFTLEKYAGDPVTLSGYRGEKNVVLVFYRGSWCPFCIEQLKELQTLLDADLKSDTELLVVSNDGPVENRVAFTRMSSSGAAPDFAFLSDPESAVIGRYGILNPSGSRRGIPHPATYVIDKAGVVRWLFVETDYRIRPDNAAIQAALRQIRGH